MCIGPFYIAQVLDACGSTYYFYEQLAFYNFLVFSSFSSKFKLPPFSRQHSNLSVGMKYHRLYCGDYYFGLVLSLHKTRGCSLHKKTTG